MKKKGDHLKNYYSILGVRIKATAIEIRDGYRQMAKRYHPDVAPSNREHEEKFREINEAYNVLGNPGLRKEFDLDRAARKDPRWVDFEEVSEPEVEAEPTPTHRKDRNEWLDDEDEDEGQWEEPSQPSGIFDKVFGYKQRRPERDSKARRDGPDVRYGDLETEILVTLKEVLHGAVRVINVRRKGTSESPRQHTVEVPRGVRPGHVICLRGKGRTSLSRGTTGDLFVSVRLAPNQDFQINGVDLHHRIILRSWQFVLGDVVTIPTIEGTLQAKVPAGSRPGQSLKLRNEGLPVRREKRGDLVVKLDLELPHQLSPDAKKAWEAVRRADQDAPR